MPLEEKERTHPVQGYRFFLYLKGLVKSRLVHPLKRALEIWSALLMKTCCYLSQTALLKLEPHYRGTLWKCHTHTWSHWRHISLPELNSADLSTNNTVYKVMGWAKSCNLPLSFISVHFEDLSLYSSLLYYYFQSLLPEMVVNRKNQSPDTFFAAFRWCDSWGKGREEMCDSPGGRELSPYAQLPGHWDEGMWGVIDSNLCISWEEYRQLLLTTWLLCSPGSVLQLPKKCVKVSLHFKGIVHIYP